MCALPLAGEEAARGAWHSLIFLLMVDFLGAPSVYSGGSCWHRDGQRWVGLLGCGTRVGKHSGSCFDLWCVVGDQEKLISRECMGGSGWPLSGRDQTLSLAIDGWSHCLLLGVL